MGPRSAALIASTFLLFGCSDPAALGPSSPAARELGVDIPLIGPDLRDTFAPPEFLNPCLGVEDAPTSDTLIGARVNGRSVLVRQGSPYSVARFFPSGSSDDLTIFGWQTDSSTRRILDLRFYGFHGVGSYPIGDLWGPGEAFAAYGCGDPAEAPGGLRVDFTYWPMSGDDFVPGDSVWVSEWDSVSGHLRGSFSFHVYGALGEILPITDGTFDVVVAR